MEIQSPQLDDGQATDGRVINYQANDGAFVLQTGNIFALDGTLYEASSVPVSTPKNRGIMGNSSKIYFSREKFEDNHYYTDPKWKTALHYNLFKPADYNENDANTKYPLVLFMLDAGAESKNWETVLIQGNGGTVWASDEWQAENPCFVV